MASLWQDVKLSLRMLRRNPGFALVAVLTLALGIGGTSAIFSVVNGVLLRPFPYRDPDRLVVIWERNLSRGLPYMFASPPNYADWRAQNDAFDAMGAFSRGRYILEGEAESSVVRGASVTAGMFSVVGVAPALGRPFNSEDDREGSAPVVLLSHGCWQTRFGADPDVLGRSIRLDGIPHTVVGVMPPGFEFPPPIVLEGAIPTEETELWVPFAIDMEAGNRAAHFMTVIARLRDGVDLGTAGAEMSAIARRLQQEYPSFNAGWDITLTPLDRQVLGDVSVQLLILLGAVCLVLLIACVNVANLLLARGTTRLKEFALRASLGAGRGRLLRQLITESLGLSLLGGLAGLGVAVWGARALARLGPQDIPRLEGVGLDASVLGFTLLVSLLTGVLFGLAPAFQGATENLSQRLREAGRGQAESRGSSRLRSALVVAEVGLSLVLLVGAGLLIQSFARLSGVETGFDAADRTTLTVSLLESRYPEDAHRVAAYAELERRFNSSPGIEAAGFINAIPLAVDRGGTSFLKEGETEVPPNENRSVNFAVVTPTYFEAMGIRLVAGRRFSEIDGPQVERVVVVNDAFVRRHFPGRDPLGIRLGLHGQPFRVVGVVGGVRHASLRVDPNPSVYVPYAQVPWSRSMSLVVRGDPDAGLAAARAVIRRFDPTLPIYDVKPMERIVGESLARMRFSTTLMLAFAIVALLLAAVGIYGVIAYSVSRRTQEIGVRLAIGAERSDVLQLVLGQGMRLVGIGILVGVAAALALSRFLGSLLYGVGTTDVLTLIGVALLLVIVAVLACYVPARRAMRVDPVEALRYE
ncbi:MAG: ABC transporter permease [Gemmatimonadales bacterium]|jgi:putative ABC transport system permease protein